MDQSKRKSVPSDVFSFLLPNEQQTSFLRACLWTGKKGHHAWNIWREKFSDPLDFLKQKDLGVKGLTLLLYHNLQRNGVAIEDSLLTFFHTAQIYEEMRTKVFREICHKVLSEMIRAKIRFLVVKGAALSDTAYDTPALRHCHDLDIVLDEDDPHDTVRLLTSLDFAILTKNISSQWENIALVHQHGLPVSLHKHLFGNSFYNRDQKYISIECERERIADVPCQVLTPPASLLHVCGQAFSSGCSTLPTWVADSWSIIARFPDLNWEHLIVCAKQCCLELPLSVMLDYLVNKLDASVPSHVLIDLGAAASRNTIGWEIALSTARKGEGGGLKRLLCNANNWQSRIPILKWMLFPSPTYIRLSKPQTAPWALPFQYVARPMEYLTRRFMWVLKN